MTADRRTLLSRCLLFGSPCLAAAVTAAGFMLPDPLGAALLSHPWERLFISVHVALAMLGSGASGWLIRGTARERIGGMLGGAGLGLILYLIALSAFTIPLVL